MPLARRGKPLRHRYNLPHDEADADIGLFDNLIERYLRRGEQEPRDLESGVFFDAVANFAAAPTEATLN